jgi:(5-formylfuran-3-yl)methyl phosphate synthase
VRLLVSLQSADEVAAATAGGADIIDAKDPAAGPLGAVSLAILRDILARVPATVPVSVALGDLSDPATVRAAVARVAAEFRSAPSYVKLGFADVPDAGAIASLIATAVEAAAESVSRPTVVPVAYADWENAGTAPPESVVAAAIAAGARAVLVDTCAKDGRTLLDWLDRERLETLTGQARSAGLLVALAGSLGHAQVDELAGLADVVGVRGSVCRGGRNGALDAELVRALRERMLASIGVPIP